MNLNNNKDLSKSNLISKPNKLIYNKKYFFIVLLFLLTIFQTNSLLAGADPNADFSVDNTTPVVDETINFTDLSTDDGTITNWDWDFGIDGVGTTTDQNPTVYYTSPGLKTVSLTVTDNDNNTSDPETKTDYIQVYETYYSTGSGDPTNTNNWNTQPDGSGTAPSNIDGDCLNFIIQNGHTMTTSGTWSLGQYAGIQIEDGVLNEDDAITIQPTGSLQVDNDGRLNHNVNALSIFGGTENLADNSVINYGHTGNQDVEDLNYGNLILSGENTKTLQGNITVANDLTIENNTTLNTGNNTLTANAAQSTASFSMGDGAAFNIEGSFQSNFSYNNISLHDNSTVSYLAPGQAVASAPYGNLIIDGGGTIQGDVRVNTSLNLVNGNLSTGSGTNNITIAADASFSANGGFSETRMIECDGDGNLIKEGNNLSDLEMVYPVGSGGTYSPVEVNSISGTINGTGSFGARAKDGIAPNANVNDLERHWITYADNLDNPLVDMTFTFDETESQSSDYKPMFSDGSNWYEVPSSSQTDTTFTVNDANHLNGITWSLVESTISTYYSYKSGDWDNPDNWTTDPSGSLYDNEDSAVPSENDRAVILNGRTITVSQDNKDVLSLQINEGGTLDLGSTSGHDFRSVKGQGLLRLSTNNFPGGEFDDFVSANGGTVEYYNSTDFTFDQLNYNNLILNLADANNVAMLMGDMNVHGDFTIQSGRFQINNGAGASRIVDIDGSVTVEENGRIQLGTGNYNHRFIVKGDFTNNGVVRFTNQGSPDYYNHTGNGRADAVFNSATVNQDIVCNGQTDFYRIEIDKGIDQSYILNIDASEETNFELFGPNVQDQTGDAPDFSNPKALGLLAGTVRLGENIVLPSLSENNSYIVDEDARLWLDGADVTYSTATDPFAGTALILYGDIRISANTTFYDNSKQGFVFRTTSSILIESGEISTVQVRPSYQGHEHRGAFTMTGGTLEVRGDLTDEWNYPGLRIYAPFMFPYPDNTFTMSGGTINILTSNPLDDESAEDFSFVIGADPNNVSVTGGTFNVTVPDNRDAYFTSTAPFWKINFISGSDNFAASPKIYEEYGDESASIPTTEAQPLVVLNELNLQNSARLTSGDDDVNVLIEGDFTINSGTTYSPGTNTTIFNGEGSQSFTNSGNITDGLYNLTLMESADLTLEGTEDVFDVRNNFNIGSNTTLRDNNKTVSVEGNITNSGTHYRPSGAAGSIRLTGTNDQTITGDGTGSFNNLTINKTGGTIDLTSNMTINGELRLASNHVLNIADHQLILGENGVVYSGSSGTNQDFDADKMIITNGLNSDDGVEKFFSDTEEFLFPYGFNFDGTNYYMPALIQFTSEPAQYGSVISRPVKETHHLIQGTNNALTTYWKNNSSGFDGIPDGSVEHKYFYDAGASNDFVEGTEGSYIPGVYRFGTEWQTLNDVNLVDQSINEISFINQPAAEGEYTAGESSAFAEIPVLYSSGENNDWNNPETWSDTGVGEAGGAGTPDANTIVVIGDETHNDTVNINNDDQDCGALFIANGSMLDLGTTQGHTFAAIPEETVTGSGTLRISSSGYFPAGDFGDFLDTEGGTVEYYASENNINIPAASESGLTLDHYRNLILNNQGFEITLPNTDLTIYENLTVEGTSSFSQTSTDNAWDNLTVNGNFNINSGEFRISEATEVKTIKVLGDLSISQNGAFRVDDTAPDFNHIFELYGNLINDGAFNAHDGNRYLNTYFKGRDNASISGNGDPYNFYDITIDKGNSPGPLVRLESEITTGITNPFLTLDNGTFRVDNASLAVTLTDGTTDFNIPSTAALSVESGEVQLAYGGDDADLLLSGRLEVLGGSMFIGDPTENYNNSIEYAAAGTPEIVIHGGELHINGQIRRPTNITSGALNYVQSGGEVTVYGKNRIQNRGLIEITNNNSLFNVSGGTLKFDNPSTSGTTFRDIYLRPDSYDVTGGTLQFGIESSAPDYDFKLSTSSPLWNINVGAEGGNNQVLTTEVYETTILNNLTINGNSQFHANGLNLNIGGNFTNNNITASPGIDNGGFYTDSNTQTVTFNGDGNQKITGSGTNLTNFANVKINTNSSVELQENSTIRINGDLNLSEGELIDGGNTIELTGDVTNTATHSSPNSAGGIKFTGSSNQRISGIGGVFGNIIMNNYSGVSLQDRTNIEGVLTFNKGSIYVDDYRLTFGKNAAIDGSPGVINMIILNGALSDRGVEKEFGTGTSSFTMPIGVSGKYTPATYDISSNSNPGSIIVRPVNRRHPAIVDTENESELAYYWKVDSTGFGDDLQLSHTYKYIQEDVKTEGGIDESDYHVGLYRIHDYEWLDLGDSVDPGEVDESENNINIQDVGYVTGDITAGEPGNFTPPLEIYYSRNDKPNDDWTDPDNWSTEGHDDNDNIATIPPNGNPVVIAEGHTINLNEDDQYSVSVEVNGTLDCGTTIFHDLGTVFGTGKINITSTAEGSFVFPGGSFDEFFETPGTTVEFMGDNTASLPLKPGNFDKPYQNVIFSGTGQKNMSAENMKVLGDLTIQDNTTLNNALYDKDLYISGDWTNENTTEGGFVPGTGKVIFEGDSRQNMNLTSAESFYNLTMNNTGDGLELTGNAGFEITQTLTLDDGIVYSFENKEVILSNTSPSKAVEGVSTASHVDGPVQKLIIEGGSFNFPVGNGGRLGRITLENTTAPSSPAYWTARYMNKDPNTGGYLTAEENLNAPLTSVSDNEYWLIERPEQTASANISLRWDENSFPDITDDPITRQLLRLVEYEETPEEWSERGQSVSGSASYGTVSTTNPVTEDDYIFSIGVIGVTATFDNLTDVEICDNEEIATIPVNLTGSEPWSLTYQTSDGVDTTTFTEENINTSTYNIQLRGSDIGGEGVYNVELVSVSDASTEGITTDNTVSLTVLQTYKPEITGSESAGTDETRQYSTPDHSGSTYTWSWVGASGGTIQSPNTNTTDITFNEGSGTYSLEIIEESSSGCLATDQITIEVLDVPVPDITPKDANLCEESTVIYSTPENTGNEYRWSVDGGTCNTSDCGSWRTAAEGGNTIEVTWNTPGEVSIEVEERVGSSGPIGTASQDYVIYKQPDSFTATIEEDPICDGNSTNVVIEDSESDITYQLHLSSDDSEVGDPVPGTGGSIELPTGNLSETTEFYVTAYNLGCELDSDPIEVTVLPEPEIFDITPLVTDTAFCEGDPGIEVGLDGSESGVVYELYVDGSPAGSTVNGTGNAIYFGEQTTEGNYTVEAHREELSTCTQVMNGSVNITENPLPDPEPYSDYPDPVCYEEGLSVTLYANDITGIGDDWEWAPADSIDNPFDENTNYQPSSNPNALADTTMFKVRVEQTSTGCWARDSVQVIILRKPETGNQHYVPNEFD